MIEPIMYLAIGFLVSMLFGLMIVPLVHNRAVRLTTRRLEAATPLSMAEIQADKDQLRAEFAMSARRLEMNVEQLKNKTTSQLAELGKKTDAINRMKIELGEKNATIFSLEAREKAVKEQLRATEEEFAAKTELLRSAEQALTDKQAELAKINHELTDRSMTADSRQVELVAVRTQIEELKGRVGDAEKEFSTTQARLAQERADSERATRELSGSAQPRRKFEPARHRSRPAIDRPGQGSRDARQPRQRSRSAAGDARQAAGRTRIRKQSAQADQRNRRARRDANCARRSRRSGGGNSPVDGEIAQRESRGRGTASRRPRRARQTAARHQRDPAAGRKLLGRPSGWKTRCCASASTTSPPRSPNSRCSSRARIRRSRPCWPRNRPCRKPRPSPPTTSPGPPSRLGRRRHARRTHPRAAVARFPRPPAGGVIRPAARNRDVTARLIA